MGFVYFHFFSYSFNELLGGFLGATGWDSQDIKTNSVFHHPARAHGLMVTSRCANRTWHKRHICGDRKALGETEGVIGWGGVAHILFYFKRKKVFNLWRRKEVYHNLRHSSEYSVIEHLKTVNSSWRGVLKPKRGQGGRDRYRH